MGIVTVRINELPPNPVVLSLGDLLPVWVEADDVTRRVSLQDLLDFFVSGGVTTTHPPVAHGGRLVYIVPEGIGGGITTVSIPSLAGKDFALNRGGFPLIALKEDESNIDDAEYTILDAGGFQLIGSTLAPGERYELLIWSLIAQGPQTPSSTGSGGIRGKKLVVESVTLDPVNDMWKVIQIRAGSNSRTVTLPDIANVPEYAELIIETAINNSKPQTIIGTGGQNFYMKNSARTSLFMHPGETLRLFRDVDGWYVINDFYLNYKEIGKPVFSYRVSNEDNEILCAGQELIRADYPRLWEYANSLGTSIVSESAWSLASATVAGRTVTRPNRAKFSIGNGSTTFRLPDLQGLALRGLKSGSDSDRHTNVPGNYQRHEYESHFHLNGTEPSDDSSYRQGAAHPVKNWNVSNSINSQTSSTSAVGGSETRIDNAGGFWVMRH